ncbi:unnamed protein product [Protopolystoma xenopodis]|uniref:Uncharacterized protein n=1 Tax=Protopolystoma xenopodis TaxID=117903 RepID=A0A448WCB4_9PLAT|nr:unnamed protein product [Protopolystoma xenopodis]
MLWVIGCQATNLSALDALSTNCELPEYLTGVEHTGNKWGYCILPGASSWLNPVVRARLRVNFVFTLAHRTERIYHLPSSVGLEIVWNAPFTPSFRRSGVQTSFQRCLQRTTTGISRRLLVRSTNKTLHHALSYEITVSSTMLSLKMP